MRKISYKSIIIAIAMLAIVISPIAGNAALDVGLSHAEGIGLGNTDLRDTIASIINVAMGLLGTVSVVIILFGGFKWMTAGGESTNVEKARKLIINGIIGLVIILSAYAIATFVINSLLTSTNAVIQ